MKKYYINNLYVIEVKTTDGIQYLICKYNKINNTYKEILTNKIVKVSNKANSELLTNYYFSLEQYKYFIRKSLYVNKNEILKIYADINYSASLEKEKALSESNNYKIDENKILENATQNFFPNDGTWYVNCYRNPQELFMANMPCHLNDDLWLAKMLKINQNLLYISTEKILEFVKNSPIFQEKKHNYELEIVKWQIRWMKNGGENWITDKRYGGEFTLFTPVCDLGFRKGIVDTLTKIGINRESIEEGIEINAEMWRDELMKKAFINEYRNLFLDYENNDVNIEEFEEKWLKLRKYQYYQNNKESVNKYGIIEPEMIMTEQELKEIQFYLIRQHEIIKKQIANTLKFEITSANEDKKTLVKKYN